MQGEGMQSPQQARFVSIINNPVWDVWIQVKMDDTQQFVMDMDQLRMRTSSQEGKPYAK